MSSIIDDLIFYRAQREGESWGNERGRTKQALEQLSKNFTVNQGAILLNSREGIYCTLNKFKLQFHEYSVRLWAQLRQGALRVQARLLQESHFKRVQSKQTEILLLKQAAKHQFQNNSESPFCIHRGYLIMVQKIYFYLIERVNRKKLIDFYNAIFNKNIRELEDFVNKQARFLGKHTAVDPDYSQFLQDIHISQILSASNVNFDVSEEKSEYSQVEEAARVQKQQIKSIIKRVDNNSILERSVSSLYHKVALRLESERLKTELELDFQRNSRRLSGLLQVSKYSGDRKIDDFIFNMVKVQLKETMAKPFSEGGSCQLFIAKADISYINSTDSTCYFKNEDKKEKIIALKKLKPEMEKKFKHKLEHEKNIVAQLKGGCSHFIPKYFRVTPQFERSDTLLMEYIQGEELDYFVASRHETLSLQTKLHVLINIVHGMRHLVCYQIVHLDLKPINILVCRNNSFLITKIIDFGQAYHKKVCQEDYSPGYTFPYVAPEVFIRYDRQHQNKVQEEFQFSEKQDVFGFGFIMYEVIFNNKAFQLTPQRFKEVYSRKEILSHLFLAYERLEHYGDGLAMSTLIYLIIRCLDPKPENRPRFDWIGILLRLVISSTAAY